jgi:hypothetical protein
MIKRASAFSFVTALLGLSAIVGIRALAQTTDKPPGGDKTVDGGKVVGYLHAVEGNVQLVANTSDIDNAYATCTVTVDIKDPGGINNPGKTHTFTAFFVQGNNLAGAGGAQGESTLELIDADTKCHQQNQISAAAIQVNCKFGDKDNPKLGKALTVNTLGGPGGGNKLHGGVDVDKDGKEVKKPKPIKQSADEPDPNHKGKTLTRPKWDVFRKKYVAPGTTIDGGTRGRIGNIDVTVFMNTKTRLCAADEPVTPLKPAAGNGNQGPGGADHIVPPDDSDTPHEHNGGGGVLHAILGNVDIGVGAGHHQGHHHHSDGGDKPSSPPQTDNPPAAAPADTPHD